MDAPISHSGLFGEAVSAVVDKFRSAKSQSAALNQFMPRRARDFSTPSSSVSREQTPPRKEPPSGGAQATRLPPTTVWGAHGRSSSRQQPRKRVNMKRPNKPAASANPGRSWPPGALLHGGGCRCFQAFSTPNLRYVFPCTTLWSLCHTSFTNGSVYPGYRCGFSAQFEPVTLFSLGEIPPRFDGVHLTVVNSASKASVLQQELSSLLQKGAIEEVPQSEVEQGFFSRYFLVPKRDGGLRPILDLRRLNLSLYEGKFKMLTMRTIMSQVQEGDWFVTIDLKDAYFHIQVVQRHRRFLRFAFGGKAYQYKVLPFGLALAPRTFTKCMDAALAPLRLQGIRVLNYLDDWLILAHSRELVSRHRDIVLGHIHSLGLRMNAKKSVLLPSQWTVFLGVRLDSVQMQARLAPARIPVFTACLAASS